MPSSTVRGQASPPSQTRTCGRRQLAKAVPDRVRSRDIFIKKITGQTFRIEASGDLGMLEDRLGLGAEDQAPGRGLGIDQGLLSHPVSSQDQAVSLLIPEGESEHPVQVTDEVDPVLFIEVDQALRVGLALEGVALSLGAALRSSGSL